MIVRYQITYGNDVYDVLSLEMDPKDYKVTAVTVLKGEELCRITEGFGLKAWTGSYDLNGKPLYTLDKVVKDNKVEVIPTQTTGSRVYCYKV